MGQNGIVAYREKLEQVIGRYHDFLGDEAESLCREHSIPSTKGLQADLASIADEDRLLKIGIVGRVNSGKSSLLNALLFGGQSIIPKAATPMTAALTTLSYGETPLAEVEFFSQEDMEDIKDKDEEYNRQLDRCYKENLAQEQQKETRSRKSPEERARSKAEREMREKVELLAAHEQYTKMTNTGLSTRNLGKNAVIEFEKISDLGSQLDDYVGAEGKYMPFTKSVNIQISQENLKDIEIVDTPGINDPVQSREARTREHLNQCDVVLIISPSGQFMNAKDLELMDRIIGKEGIRELFVVAAQADTQLFGNLMVENNGQLDRVLDSITRELGTELEKIILELKKANPEVGNAYDQLLQEQSQVIYSSGLCESLKQLFGQKDEWDKGMQHVWNKLLVENYPDYFSDADAELSRINLDKLSNISAIRGIIEEVGTKKQEIIEKKRKDYVQAKRQSLHALKDGLLKYADERRSQIESTDIRRFKEQSKRLEQALNNASWDIKLDYEESVDNTARALRQKLQESLRKMKEDIGIEIDGTIKTEGRNRLKEGFWEKIFRNKENYTHTTVRTNAAYDCLLRFSVELTGPFTDIVENEKKGLREGLIRDANKTLRSHFDYENLEASMIRRVIRVAINSISIPNFEYELQMPKSLSSQSVLEGDEAETFRDNAENYFYSLYNRFYTGIETYTKAFAAEMKKVRLGERLLEESKKELAALENLIENKEMELKRISYLKGELKEVEVDH